MVPARTQLWVSAVGIRAPATIEGSVICRPHLLHDQLSSVKLLSKVLLTATIRVDAPKLDNRSNQRSPLCCLASIPILAS